MVQNSATRFTEFRIEYIFATFGIKNPLIELDYYFEFYLQNEYYKVYFLLIPYRITSRRNIIS